MFWGFGEPIKLVGIFYDQTGSARFKMAAINRKYANLSYADYALGLLSALHIRTSWNDLIAL